MEYLEIWTPAGSWRIALTRDRLSIGRVARNDISLRHAQISRQHAEVRRVAGEWWIVDLNSTNGLHVGERRVREHLFAPGDRVLLAPDVSLRYVSADMASGEAGGMPASAIAAPSDGHTPPEGLPSAAATLGPAPARLPAGGSNPDASADRPLPARQWPIGGATLHVCQTCGALTAPDVAFCSTCHHSIATRCLTCGMSLLPIQDRCPRCQAPNPISVQRASRGPGAE
jgi:hypothetical protein